MTSARNTQSQAYSVIVLVLLVLAHNTECQSILDGILSAYDSNAIRKRFVEYTDRVDVVLSGNTGNEAMNALMEMFSPDFTTWNTMLVSDVDPTPPRPPILLEGGVGLSQLRQKYYNISTQLYANYSEHMLHETGVTYIGMRSPGRPIYNTRARLTEYASMSIFSPGGGVKIIGSYDCDWVKDTDGVFRMARFFSNTRKMYREDNLPGGSAVLPGL